MNLAWLEHPEPSYGVRKERALVEFAKLWGVIGPAEQGMVDQTRNATNERKKKSADNDSFKLFSFPVLRARWPSSINNKIYNIRNKNNKEAGEHKYGKQGKPLGSTESGWAPPLYSLNMPK